MEKIKKIYFYYLSGVISFLFFLPNFINSNLGSDWDSYALIGTHLNFFDDNTYIPSRPPGFPGYELIVSTLIKFSELINFISLEQILLFFQFVIVLLLNYLIYSFFSKNELSNYLFFILLIISPVYVISSISVIDYALGSLFGFLSFYIYLYKERFIFILPICLTISIASRLSNLIFLFAIIFVSLFIENDFRKTFSISFTTIFLILTFYYFPYNNLYSAYFEQGVMSQPVEFLCILNLTNTEMSLVDRIGRIVLKHINLLGTLGSVVILFLLKNFKMQKMKLDYLLLFTILLFELSFFRLPTEEGHLMPVLISLVILFGRLNLNPKLVSLLILFVLSSNFVEVKFYSVDEVDSASSINIELYADEGYYLQDYDIRNQKSENKEFHYLNSKKSIKEAWVNGCPN
tara:strand:- start:3501 stop:4712 length:1212 start_codon:yes stop_codon:yes gene_type:complete